MPPAAVKITVVGTGYVGISNAVLLAQRNRVVALDIDARKVAMINAMTSPIAAPEIEEARVLWRMAAGAGFLAAATVLFALTFGSGLEDELGRLLFYDPSGQVVVSLLGV